MRRRTVWLAAVFAPLLLLVARNVQGATVFTEDVTFVDGDVYRSVEIHEDAHAEVLGGRFGSRFQLYDDATATLRGGNFRGIFSVGDSSRATIHPDTSINTYIFMSGSAELDIFGGRMPDRFLDAAAWGGDPRVTFHGYDLFLDPIGGSQGDGLVTGVFANGNAFAVHLRGAETASRVRLAEMKYPAQLENARKSYNKALNREFQKHLHMLRDLQVKMEKAGSRYGVARIESRLAELSRQGPPTDGSLSSLMPRLKGRWVVTYTNRTQHTREIRENQLVNQRDKLVEDNGDILILFPNVIERITLVGDKLFVEHFNPSSTYPNGIPAVMGVARKTNSLKIPTAPRSLPAGEWERAVDAQKECGQRLRLPVEIMNTLGMKLKLIPAGEFVMGSNDFGPQHKVRITKPFYLGVHEVTQTEYKKVMGKNPSWFANGGSYAIHVSGEDTSRHPVENISWEDAVEFCKILSAEEGRAYRLPTEAQWEYACRAGSTTQYSFGDDPACVGEYAWYSENCNHATHPVGEKKPNAWGLHDMHGNVWEWCADWHGLYASEAVTDPSGPETGSYRVFRGGSWGLDARYCPAAFRYRYEPQFRYGHLGFRVAADPADGEPLSASAKSRPE